VVVDASIVARLLGIRLLRIDAVLTLSPARIVAPAASPRARRAQDGRPIGAGLALARRHIDEGAASLVASRSRTTSVPR
jgi:hypothetical protein